MSFVKHGIATLVTCMAGCVGGMGGSSDDLSKEVRELNTYRNQASLRCSGVGYRYALGQRGEASFKGAVNISEKLLSKGFGTGNAEIGLTLQEKSELAVLLGNMTNEQVDRFLGRYQSCMTDEMIDFHKIKGQTNPVPPTSRVPCHQRDNVFVVGKMDIHSNHTLKHGTVCLANGAMIHVRNGATFAIEAETLIVEGTAVFDGPGEPGLPGAPGITPNDFVHTPGGTGPGYDHNRCIREFGAFGTHPDDLGGAGMDGRPGGNGAKIHIRFKMLVGNTSGISSNVRGGTGGQGGPGGLGRKMRCFGDQPGTTRIAQELRRGPSGKAGPMGTAGSFSIQQVAT